MRKLIDFEIKENEKNLHFIIFGDFITEKTEDENFVPVFKNVSMKKVENGAEEDWEPSSVSWTGIQMKPYHAMVQTYDDLIRNATKLNILYLDDEIQKLKSQYEKEFINYDGKKILKRIHSYCLGECNLILCTNQFAYYYSKASDELVMVRIHDGEVVAGCEFAQIGFYDSLDNIKADSNEEFLVFSSQSNLESYMKPEEGNTEIFTPAFNIAEEEELPFL